MVLVYFLPSVKEIVRDLRNADPKIKNAVIKEIDSKLNNPEKLRQKDVNFLKSLKAGLQQKQKQKKKK